MNTKRHIAPFIAAILAALVPAIASAHEVYVLSANEIAADIQTPPFDMLAVVRQDMAHFIFWAAIGFATVTFVFLLSISRRAEKAMHPYLMRMKRYAPAVARVTVGLAFLAGAYYQATYGPELPIASIYGTWAPIATAVLVLLGLSIMFNVMPRIAALVALLMYLIACYFRGAYMLTYTNYLGEIIVLLLGVHERGRLSGIWGRIKRAVEPYSFTILRVCFGTSLLYASIYAKILHNNLALQVATLRLAGHPFELAYYMGLEPHFLVLGAAIVELVIGAFFVLGIEIRFTSFFMLFWLSLSLFYFGESVWPHIILIGIPIAFILHGYDRGSLEGRFFAKRSGEPVL